MSPVGHSIIGLACASACMPFVVSLPRRFAIGLLFVALANLPDWPIPNWGHDRYDISHSVFVNLALLSIVAVAVWRRVGGLITGLGSTAWMSHLLLDSFYNHGRGIAVCWPFSKARLNLAMPWFNNLDLSQSPFSADNLRVYGVEAVAFSLCLR